MTAREFGHINIATTFLICCLLCLASTKALSHESAASLGKHSQDKQDSHGASHQLSQSASARYLANEGVLITVGKVKVLFDPFFHNDYNIYQLVPDDIVEAIMGNKAPYNDISVIFVSHAHGDHFAEKDMLNYMLKQTSVKLVAPTQAIREMQKLDDFGKVSSRITPIDLAYKDEPISFTLDQISVDAVRIPHAGWPGRAEVSNIVYRVRLPENNVNKQGPLTFIHMGDADPNDMHFRPLRNFWEAQETTLAFPPYWFFLSNTGNYILDYRINAEKSVGVHVPKQVPSPLILSEKPYFSKPGEVMIIDAKEH
jgi:L-ascorbate metabolism protein UlaG (beta-lactamase superfamily)